MEWDRQLSDALAACRAVDVTAAADDHLLEDIELLAAARDEIDGLMARRLEVAHAREATVAEHGQTTKTWLQTTCRLSAHDAGQRLFLARSLSEAPRLAEAVEAGEVGHDAARIIVSVLRDLWPTDRPPAEKILVDLARLAPPAQVAAAGREIIERTLSRERREEAEMRRFASRGLSTAVTFGGMVSVSGLLDPEGGEALLAALSSLARRTCAEDARTPAQRKADALGQLSRHQLECTGLPDNGGERPQLVLTMTYDQLRDSDGTATLEHTGLPISAGAARRLACDAAVIPAVLGGDGAVLDLGRTTRTWTTAIRRAARLRDQGCTFPGCSEGLDRCELHHIVFWANGGQTSLANSAHVCRFHHWLIHERGWSLRRAGPTSVIAARPDGTLVHDPPWAEAG